MHNNIPTLQAAITSVAHYVPEDIFDNNYFKDVLGLETNDQWIRERTGIIERRYLRQGGTSDLAVPAAKKCLEKRGISAEEIDCIIVATVTPDMAFPSTACLVQNKLGAKNAWGFDIEAACSGFLFALRTGSSFIASGQCKKVLVIGADKMSAILNFKDRNTCVLFGDGAGCVLLEPTEDKEVGIMDFELHIDGSGGEFLYMPAGGSLMPPSPHTVANDMHYVVQDGKAVFKVAVMGMADVAESIMKKNNLSAKDIRWLVPHQANLRIISATADRMGLPMDNVMVNINRYGNTTAGTLPICLSEWHENGLIDKGDGIILATFGAGYTWGSGFLKWAY